MCLAGDPESSSRPWGTGSWRRSASSWATGSSPHDLRHRAAQAEADRRVTDSAGTGHHDATSPRCCRWSRAVGGLAALTRYADAAVAAGDQRGRRELMADRLVELVTGQATADGGTGPGARWWSRTGPCSGSTSDAATVRGGGPIPAEIAASSLETRRRSAAGRPASGSTPHPRTGQLVGMVSRSTPVPRRGLGRPDRAPGDADRCRHAVLRRPDPRSSTTPRLAATRRWPTRPARSTGSVASRTTGCPR